MQLTHLPPNASLPAALTRTAWGLTAILCVSARQDASGNLQATGSLPPASQPVPGLQQGDELGELGSPHRRLASPHRRFFISSPVRGMVSPLRGMVQFTGAAPLHFPALIQRLARAPSCDAHRLSAALRKTVSTTELDLK
jgi:hypothetical protein